MSKKKKDFPKEKSDLRGAERSASLRQGCVLIAHGDPQHITSALRQHENLRDYNIMLGILDFTGSGHWAPFNLSQNTAMIMVKVPPTTPCKLYLVSMYQQGNNAVIQSYSRVRKDESSRQKMRSKCFVWGLVWLATPLDSTSDCSVSLSKLIILFHSQLNSSLSDFLLISAVSDQKRSGKLKKHSPDTATQIRK